MDDLTSAMKRSDPTYFLGSIVLVKQVHEPESIVVDGQQRLTTLTLLFCVLRDLANSDEDTLELHNRVRTPEDRLSGTQGRFHLKLRLRDREFFQKNIQQKGSIDAFLRGRPGKLEDSRQHLFDNVEYLHQRFRKQDAEERFRLVQYIVKKCYLVVVSTPDEELAHRMFLVLNDRGLNLSATDVLKADVVAKIPEVDQDHYTKQWEGLEAEDREEFARLFAHIRTIYRKYKQQETLIKEFRRHVLKLDSLTPEGAKFFVDDILMPYSEVYKEVSRAQCESTKVSPRVNALLSYLNRIDNFDWIPAAMAYFHRSRGNSDSILAFTTLLERLAYGMFILRVNVNRRVDRYAEVLRLIEEDGDLFTEDSPLQLESNEKTEILQRLRSEIYGRPRIPMPLLLRLDSLLAGGGATYHRPIISIEHVLPQHPSPDSEWLRLFSEDERAYWRHRLANLVLLSRRKNAQASNFDFAKKKSGYFGEMPTPFALTSEVIEATTWTPAVLECRQNKLVERLKQEWRLD